MAWTTYPTVSDGTPTHNKRALTDAEAAAYVGADMADLNESGASVANQCDAKYKVWPLQAFALWAKNKLITLVNAANGFVQLDGAGKLPAVDGSQLTNLPVPSGIPVSSMIPFASATVPDGWLLCDGSAVSQATYAALFAAIGMTYGDPLDGVSFKLPNSGGRTVIGVGTGPYFGATARALGDTGGEETHTLLTAEIPSHAHGVPVLGPGGTASPGIATDTLSDDSPTTIASTNTGGDGAHNNMQPYLACNLIIKF